MNNYYDNETFNVESFPLSPGSTCEFVECQFNGIDFTAHNFSRLKFIDCEFSECNLSNVDLRSTTLRDAVFKKSKLVGVNWCQAATLANISFYSSILDYGVFQSLNLKGTVFSDCKMSEVDFYEAQLTKAIFTDCLLTGAVFNKANLSEADFRGAREYYIDVRQTIVKKAKFSLPEALTLLSSLEISLE